MAGFVESRAAIDTGRKKHTDERMKVEYDLP